MELGVYKVYFLWFFFFFLMMPKRSLLKLRPFLLALGWVFLHASCLTQTFEISLPKTAPSPRPLIDSPPPPSSSRTPPSDGSPLSSPLPSGASVVIHPLPLVGALRNPLMGFRDSVGTNPWSTTWKDYIPWNAIETVASDGVDKLIQHANTRWKGSAHQNAKVIPRVYLEWDAAGGLTYWPSDMTTGDFTSGQFQTRLAALVQKMGQAWDTDPRVAWIEMGIFGYFGEQWGCPLSSSMQSYAAQLFQTAFKNKLVLVRYVNSFPGSGFGIYADSFANAADTATQNGLAGGTVTGNPWLSNIVEGEVAYDWGQPPGAAPDITVQTPAWVKFIIDTLHQTHATALGWISGYTTANALSQAGAAQIQAAFGYRLVITEISYPASIALGQSFDVHFSVQNQGSAPFYYPWPVRLALLDPTTHSPVWSATFSHTQIQKWQPGDQWSAPLERYGLAPLVYQESDSFLVPVGALPSNRYLLALAILDPAGNTPSARFAIQNHFAGGFSPLDWTGVGVPGPQEPELPATLFIDPNTDTSLSYVAPN